MSGSHSGAAADYRDRIFRQVTFSAPGSNAIAACVCVANRAALWPTGLTAVAVTNGVRVAESGNGAARWGGEVTRPLNVANSRIRHRRAA